MKKQEHATSTSIHQFINSSIHQFEEHANIENHDFSSKIMIFHDFVQKSYKIMQNHAKSLFFVPIFMNFSRNLSEFQNLQRKLIEFLRFHQF